MVTTTVSAFSSARKARTSAPVCAVRQMPCDWAMSRPRSLSVGARQKSGRGGAWISSTPLNFSEQSVPARGSKVAAKSRPVTVVCEGAWRRRSAGRRARSGATAGAISGSWNCSQASSCPRRAQGSSCFRRKLTSRKYSTPGAGLKGFTGRARDAVARGGRLGAGNSPFCSSRPSPVRRQLTVARSFRLRKSNPFFTSITRGCRGLVEAGEPPARSTGRQWMDW